MLIQYTYVDANTRRPLTEEPAAAGPVVPDVPGLAFDFANESEWPCLVPIFYGQCDDGADPITPGVLDVLTREIYEAARSAEMARRIERKKSEVRGFRGELLVRSDWTQLVDAPLTEDQKTEWRTYRQALRDVTGQAGFPESVVWPAAPGMTQPTLA